MKIVNFIKNNGKKYLLYYRGVQLDPKKNIVLLGTNLGCKKNIIIQWNLFVNKFSSILAGRTSTVTFTWDCLIWPGAIITSTNHIIDKNHTAFDDVWEEKDVIIWDNVWIGGNAVILPWVSLANGTIVAAGSVVTKSVTEEYVTVWGIPAKILKTRN